MFEVPFGIIIVTTFHSSRKKEKRLFVLARLPDRRETGEQLPGASACTPLSTPMKPCSQQDAQSTMALQRWQDLGGKIELPNQ